MCVCLCAWLHVCVCVCVCVWCVCVCVCLCARASYPPSSTRCYVKQLELVCLPGHARDDSRGKSVAALCVEGLVMVVGFSCHLGEKRRGAMLHGVVASSEGPEQEVDAVALHLVRKFQVCVCVCWQLPTQKRAVIDV